MIVNGLNVTVDSNGDLVVEGLGVVHNPLTSLDLSVDYGQLWLSIWAEGLYNKPVSARIRALLLNSLDLSVQKVIQAITKQT